MSFMERLITITVQLAQGTQTNQPTVFAESGLDTVTFSGLRTSVRIFNSGAPADQHATIKVFGLTPSVMNQLSTLGLVFNLVPKNQITVQAGDVDSPGTPATVFTGTIWAAYGDYDAQPNVSFTFECLAGAAAAAVSIPPSSFQGSADVATIMSGLARQMQLGFTNHGVHISLKNPYFSGSAKEQARKCAEAAGLRGSWGIFGNSLEIWPAGGNRDTPTVPIISPDNGMINYPAFTQQGIIVKTVFDPLLAFGQLVQVKSSVLSAISAAQTPAVSGGGKSESISAQASGGGNLFPSQWAINKLDLALDAQMPGGEWCSTVYAYNPAYSRSILPPP